MTIVWQCHISLINMSSDSNSHQSPSMNLHPLILVDVHAPACTSLFISVQLAFFPTFSPLILIKQESFTPSLIWVQQLFWRADPAAYTWHIYSEIAATQHTALLALTIGWSERADACMWDKYACLNMFRQKYY